MPEIVSTVLLVLFIFLFFLSLLAFLAGFIKGLYKTTVKTLLIAALLCVFVFLTPSITIAIGNIDLSKIGFSFEFNGQQIVLTTIQETLANIITATGVISPMNGISIYDQARSHLFITLLSPLLYAPDMNFLNAAYSVIKRTHRGAGYESGTAVPPADGSGLSHRGPSSPDDEGRPALYERPSAADFFRRHKNSGAEENHEPLQG